ncbi:MAG: hypothetical protein CMJ45_14225 [Planctomyces sp.]|nr:hypothetical protein [Planctomyces sp.]
MVDDGYQPPYGVDIYYRIEALDGHGNVSGMQDYCVHTGSDGLPGKPAIKVVGIPGETVLTETLTPTADSYVDSSEPGANFGDRKTVQVGSEASEVYRAFLNFDLSGIPEGSVVKSATLLLQTDTAHAARPYDIRVRQVSQPWMESTVTWNNQPPSQMTGSVTRVDGEGTKFPWSVTQLAQAWADGGQNNGLSLRAVTENTGADLFHEFGARTPRLFATQQVEDRASPKLIVVYTQRPEVTVNYGDPTADLIEVTVILPGEDGNSTTTTTTDENVEAFEVPPGATVQLTVRGVNINGSGPGDSVLVYNVNNFLDTNRHMANLGPIFGLEWRDDGPEPGIPGLSVRLHFKYLGDDVPLPPVAAFRQAGDGSWMQVTPVLGPEKFSVGGFFNGVNTWFITDVADPSRDQAYNYSVLAFSSTSYEVLGFWESTPLAAQQQAAEPVWVSDRLAPTAESPNCAFQLRLPNEVPWGTSTILLENGWQIQVGSYRDYQNCPGVVSDINNLYGQGRLQAGAGGDSWTILFSDVGTDATGNLARGRILLAGDGLDRTLDDQFATHIGRIEFSPGEVNAEAIMELPSNVKLTNPDQGRRSNRVFGVVKNVQTDLSHNALTVKTANDCSQDDPGGIYLVDEDLPWRVYAGTIAVSRGTLAMQGDVCTRDRLGYKAPSIVQPTVPDNNLGFMRIPYKSENSTVTGDGLNGTFTTNGNISYATSLPASVAVLAKAAEVEIKNSRIRSGRLINADVVLGYFDQGTDTSRMAGQLVFRGHLPPPHGQGIPGTSIRRLSAFPIGDRSLAIGKNGILNGDISMLDDRVGWPSFEAGTRSLTFFAAAASFPDDLHAQSQDLNAPMPAENAWRQLPGPFNGDLDPGFNIIRLHDDDDVTYDCYARTFEDTDLDLYVRRGGVSENLRINGAELGQIRDASGYLNTFVKFDVLLVDNAIIEQDARLNFYLPYPSDVDIPLTVTGFAGNCPAKGEIDRGPALLHKYWNLEVIPDGRVDLVQTPETRRPYIEHLVSIGMPQREADATVPKSIMTLTGQATVNGLVQNRENPGESAVLPMTLEWLPDGDYGRISQVSPPDLDNFWVSGVSYALTGIKLSHYHQFLMRQDALPDTAGLELPATAQPLPSHLLLDGQFSQASLKACSERGDGVGCGFVILEGEGAVKYFGGIQVSDKPDTGGLFLGETPQGSWPLAINSRPGSTMFQAPIKWPELSWAWAFDDDYLEVDVPLLYLANSQGGILAGLNPDSGLLPDAPVAGTPVGLVFAADFGRETEDDLGIFVVHSASMAVLRALAMRPPGDAEVRGWDPDRWNPELEDLMEDWAKGLGFSLVVSGGEDVVDLAREIWPAWENRSFQATSAVLEPIARGETDLNLDDFFGIAGVTSDEILDQSSTSLKNGLGHAVFVPRGGDFIPDQLSMDTQMDLNMGGVELFNADWLPFELTKNKQFLFRFEDLPTDMGGVLGSGARANGTLTVGTQPGDIGIDGGLFLRDVEMYQVDIEGFGALFGAGEVNSDNYFYLGGSVKGDWGGYGVGGALLFGTIVPSNRALQEVGGEMGLGDLLAKFGERHHGPDGHTWSGAYMAVSGEFPVVQYGCLVDVGLNGELQGWYFGGDPDIYGGQIRGSVYGELGCLISARGKLALSGEQLAENGETHGRICPDDGNPDNVRSCTSFFGGFGFAAGIGFCSPGSWGEWERRWWGDSYCWQFGAEAELNYLSPAPAGEDTWENDIDWDAE